MGKICFFTGHRTLPSPKIHDIERQLENTLTELIESGYTDFRAGGALGFDTLAAKCVLELRRKHPHIRLVLILPCKDQAKSWSEGDQAVYEEIKQRADEVIYSSESYYRGCMHKRNRCLADGSSTGIAFLERYTGGTAYTVNYAEKHGVPVVNIADNSLTS